MERWLNVKLWVGQEKEGHSKEKRLFVDGANLSEIEVALANDPSITTVYFGHKIDWDAITFLIRKVRVIVEVDDCSTIPMNLIGWIDIILRVPNYITSIKILNGNEIEILERNKAVKNIWNGKKLYPTDKVILKDEEVE